MSSGAAPRRSISAVVTAAVPASNAQPRRSLSGNSNSYYVRGGRGDPRRQSLNEADARDYDRAAQLRRQSFHQKATYSGSENAADLTAYYAFSRRRSSVASEDQAGLSGFLEYRKLDGTWRPFLFQTIGYQLVVFRVHVTHQVQVMSTDIRDASEIVLVHDGDMNNTRLFRLGINNTVITLRAVSHHVAMYWLEGLQRLRAGRLPDIVHDRPTIESEEDIFRQIDQIASLREWRPAPATDPPLCGACFPCFRWCCKDESDTTSAVPAGAAAFATTQSPRPAVRRPSIYQNAWG